MTRLAIILLLCIVSISPSVNQTFKVNATLLFKLHLQTFLGTDAATYRLFSCGHNLCIFLLPAARLLTIELTCSTFSPDTLFIINLLSRRHYITTVFIKCWLVNQALGALQCAALGSISDTWKTLWIRKHCFCADNSWRNACQCPTCTAPRWKSRPLCSVCEAISEASMQLNSSICVKSICL